VPARGNAEGRGAVKTCKRENSIVKAERGNLLEGPGWGGEPDAARQSREYLAGVRKRRIITLVALGPNSTLSGGGSRDPQNSTPSNLARAEKESGIKA